MIGLADNGLHIDSYKKIDSIDGYKINIRNKENRESKNKILVKDKISDNKLWFVNIGLTNKVCSGQHSFISG